MSEPAQKCKNNPIFKQNYRAKLFLIFKMAYSCCSSLGRKVFEHWLQESMISTFN